MNLSFNFHKDHITSANIANIPFMPSKAEALRIYKNQLNKRSSLSTLRDFKPTIAVLYVSNWGHGYKLFLSEIKDIDLNKPFPDEPKGKFSTKRKTFLITEKDLLN